MSKLNRKLGATSQKEDVFIQDTRSVSGAGLTGLSTASSGLTFYYHRDTSSASVLVALAAMTLGTFTSGGFKEIDPTGMPGMYQLCPPDAAFASGAASVSMMLQGAANMAPLPLEIDLDAQVDVTAINASLTDANNLALGSQSIITGTAITGTLSNTAMSVSGTAASTAGNIWVGRTVIWTSGVLSGSQALISAYTSSNTVVTYATTQTTAAPSNGDTFIIV